MNVIPYEARADVYADAWRMYGSTQLIVALEELSEAQKEICKTLRGKVDIGHLAEEVADATIMLEQVRQIFNINPEVCKFMDYKVERLRQQIEDDKADRDARQSFLERALNMFPGG